MVIVVLVLLVFAVARLTRVVTLDKIGEPFRQFVLNRNGVDGQVTFLVHCPWCTGVWVAAVVTPIVWFAAHMPDTLGITSWVGVPLTVFAVAHLASLVCLIGGER